jgi:hypothetical protein
MMDKDTNKDGFNIGTLKERMDTLKEFLISLITSNDKRYQESFESQRQAVKDALAAQKELTTAAFNSSEKAIVKAEDAQRDYNQRSNEFRGQLDDQAQTLMPRTETNVLIAGLNDKLADQAKIIETLSTRVTTIEGRGDGKNAMWQYLVVGISALLGIVGIITFIISLKK